MASLDEADDGTKSLSLKRAYLFGAERGLQHQIAEIRDMEVEWDLRYTSTLRRGFVISLFEQHGIYDEFKSKHWSVGNTKWGQSKHRFYLKVKQRYEAFLSGNSSVVVEMEEDEETEQTESQEFASEADLRDYLAKNLERIEPGLRLYEDGQQTGVEFPVDSGFIDILAVDKSKNFVVIELKLSKGRNKAIGQILYYMGWVDENLGKTPCRGMILAKEISDELITATKRASGISLFKYHLQVTVEAVKPQTSALRDIK